MVTRNYVSGNGGTQGDGVARNTDAVDSLTMRRGDRVTPAEYRTMLAAVGWRPVAQTDAELAAALERSWNVTARTPDGHLVGLARVLDDGVLYASVWDILVVPERQRRGLYHEDYSGPTLRENLGLPRPAIGSWRSPSLRQVS